MSISIGNKSVEQIFIGNKEVQSIYIGNIPVYENYKFEWSFSDSGATLVKYTSGTRTDVKMPSQVWHDGVLYSVTAIGPRAFDNTNITSVTIPSSVTSIGSSAFYGCSVLASLTIPDGVTSIGVLAFAGCGSLTNINIPNGVTSIEEGAFAGCGLTSVTIPDSVTSIGNGSFTDCRSLASVTIGSGVESIGRYVFSGCSSLASITIPDSVTSMGDSVFEGCSSLTGVTIGNGVESIGANTFSNCYNLTNITYNGTSSSWINIQKMSGWDDNTGDYVVYCTDNVIDKQGVIYNLQGISPNETYSVIGYSGTSTSVTIKQTIGNNDITNIGPNVFLDSRITSIVIPNTVNTIDNSSFTGCQIASATMPTAAIGYVPTASLTTLVINGGNTIPGLAFMFCSSLQRADIGDSVTSIGNQAFYGCTSLTSITIPGSVTSIGSYAFSSCTSLTSVYYTGDIASWCGIEFDYGANPLEYAHNLYINNTLVTEITIPDTVTEIKAYAFYNWTWATSITIPDSVTSIGRAAFYGCTGLTSVYYTGDIASWCGISFGGSHANPLEYAHNLYINNTLVTEITIPDTVTEIKAHAFRGWNGTSITIPGRVTSIGGSAFRNCGSLTTITYQGAMSRWNSTTKGADWDTGTGDYIVICTGDNKALDQQGVIYTLSNSQYAVTSYNGSGSYVNIRPLIATYSVTSISANAFANKTSLTKVGIPSNISTIGASALSGCNGLQEIIYSGTLSQWQIISKGVDWDANTGDYVLVCLSSDIALDKHGIAYTLTQGTYHASAYSGSEVSVSIKGAINGINVTTINPELFMGNTTITNVTIPGNVQTIGENSFQECTNLTTVNLNEGTQVIGEGAFVGCSVLSTISISGPQLNTLPSTISTMGSYAFSQCTVLTNLVIPSGVNSIPEGMMRGCANFSYISLPNTINSIGELAFNVTPLETIQYAGAVDLWVSITKGNEWDFQTNNYTVICTDGYIRNNSVIYKPTTGGLYVYGYIGTSTSVVVENSVDSISVISIGESAFDNKNIDTIILPNTITSVGAYAFRNCPIIYAEMPTIAISSIPKSALQTVVINDGSSIGTSAFSGCSRLTSVTIPNSVESIGSYAFSGCINLASVFYTGNIASWCSISFGSYNSNPLCYAHNLYIDNIQMTGITIPNTVTEIKNFAFYGWNGTSVTIGSGVTSIGNYAFRYCSNLTSVTIGSGVRSIYGWAFNNCNNLTRVYYTGDIASWCGISFGSSDANPLYYAHNLYINNTLVTEITIPDTVAEIKAHAFHGWNGTSITIPDSVRSIREYAFDSCASLTTITYNGTLSQWNSITKEAGWDNDTGDYVVICTGASIDKQGVTYTLSNNVYGVTGYSGSPTSISVRDIIGGKNVTSIGLSAFDNCTSLTNITIPAGVTSIGQYAFRNCTSLTAITYNSTLSQWNYHVSQGYGWDTNTGDYVVVCTDLSQDKRGLQYRLSNNKYSVTGHFVPSSSMSIKAIVDGKNVTRIGYQAFKNFDVLKSITIPDSVTSIEYEAFSGCSRLTSITFGGTKEQWNAISKENFWNSGTGSYTIHCADGDISK